MRDDFFERTVVWAMVSFIILEALLPPGQNNFAFIFLILQSTIIFVLGLARQQGVDFTAATTRLLLTYIAFAALLINTED